MEYRIAWLPRAEKRFDEIINYIKANWSENNAKNFVQYTNQTINLILLNPLLFQESSKKGIREALITKHNLLIYKVKKDEIQLLTFFDNRQNPKKKFRL
jgi:plasmid stabilization system protein ParE